MPSFPPFGYGRKRPQVNKAVSLLHLDKDNPRLPEEAQGKDESELLNVLYRDFNLDELADSMVRNGYFDEEPLVGIPIGLPDSLRNADPNSEEFISFVRNDGTELTIVEGNRRLATAKLLLDLQLRDTLRVKWPIVSPAVADDLRILPVIVYPARSEVVPYLGVRHIVGIQKWDSFAKARYIASLKDDQQTWQQVKERLGEKQGADATQYYLCYKLMEQVHNEFDYDIQRAKQDFSLLLLAVGQRNIKQFLGLPRRITDINDLDEPVPSTRLDNLQKLMSWIFGDRTRLPVIKESRDITNTLAHVVAVPEAVEYLDATRDLIAAYERTDGEEVMLRKLLVDANTKLERALGLAHRYPLPEVVGEIEKCEKTVRALLKSVRDADA